MIEKGVLFFKPPFKQLERVSEKGDEDGNHVNIFCPTPLTLPQTRLFTSPWLLVSVLHMYFNDDISGKSAFALVPTEYDLGRPTYPIDLYRDATYTMRAAFAHSPKLDSVLEIGSGTGQATGELARLSSRLDCIEPGKSFADVLRSRFASCEGVAVHETEFERFQTRCRYNLVASASAIHWIPKEFFYSRIHSLLTPDGWLLGIWHQPRFQNAVYDIIQEILVPRFPDFRIPRFDLEERELFDNGFEEFSSRRGFRNCWKKTYSPSRVLLPTVATALIWSYVNIGGVDEGESNDLQDALHRKISSLAIADLSVIDNFLVAMGQSAYKND
jgi:SAM-dependent methyltransferase